MTLEELSAMWAEDGVLDEENIHGAITVTPALHNKYYLLYSTQIIKAKALRAKLTELKRAKSEYYLGSISQEELKERGWKPTALRILRTDLDKYLESDEDIIKLTLKIAYNEAVAKFLEDIIKQIHSRNFLIRSHIDWARFQSGS